MLGQPAASCLQNLSSSHCGQGRVTLEERQTSCSVTSVTTVAPTTEWQRFDHLKLLQPMTIVVSSSISRTCHKKLLLVSLVSDHIVQAACIGSSSIRYGVAEVSTIAVMITEMEAEMSFFWCVAYVCQPCAMHSGEV